MPSFADARVLITGGTGSFGKQMVDHLFKRGCKHIRIFSRDEAKQEAMRIQYGDSSLHFHIGDVRSRDSVDKVMRGVDLVFHAAALKQVPSCEFFPLEAVATNIIGSANVIDSAINNNVARVVCLSTDKAVMPVNAMGMTKALMEKVVLAATRDLGSKETLVSCVRYGNVMYSRGSVIPLFVQQIKSGRPLTITEPSMTRFMLALPQAIELVEFAFRHGEQGDIFVKKAPSCTIKLLAEVLIDLFNADNDIIITGVRHGEKLYETLASAEELRRAQDMGDYYRISADTRDLNYSQYFTRGDVRISDIGDYHSNNTINMSHVELIELLQSLPEIQGELASWERN